MVTVPTLDAFGQLGGVLAKLCCSSSPPSPEGSPLAPLNATCSTEQSSNPLAAPGLACTPSGSATVVSLTSASACPSLARMPVCGNFSVTSRPVGEFALVVSGCTLNCEGSN